MGNHFVGQFYDGGDARGYCIRGFIQKITSDYLWIMCHNKVYIVPNV